MACDKQNMLPDRQIIQAGAARQVRMYKEIQVKELKVGMFVADTGLPWIEHPYLYAEEGELVSQEAIDRIVRQGFQNAFIDTDRGSYVSAGPESPMADAPDGLTHAPNLVPIEEEAAVAQKIYEDSVAFARDFMRNAQAEGVVDYEKSEALVDDMIQSVARNHDALVSLSKLRACDEYTYTHCINVAVIAVAFGQFLGLVPEKLKPLGLSGLFHDLGKARVPLDVLNKPGKLTDAEFEVIKAHPLRSYQMLKERQAVGPDILRGIVEHHEKHNGQGYPRGLSGDQISLFGRILALADIYDAITSRRVYKESISPSKSLKIMYGMRDQTFSTAMLVSFVKFLGVYPVGSLVRLSDGTCGVVCESNPYRAHEPVVKVAFDADLRAAPIRKVDLFKVAMAKGRRLEIVECLDHERYGIDPARFLTGD